MYSTCLFCNQDLGRNEVVEAFPVGRRLAFDAAKGRLWVVCRKCERWNLTPLEERWEAIEQCERLFSGTRMRVSTDNVGLARLTEGLELVRIGAPKRPEMAAWRYGDQFGRRRRRHLLMTAGALATAGAVIVAGPVAGLVSVGTISPILNSFNVVRMAHRSRKRLRLPLANGDVVETTLALAGRARLLAEEDGIGLEVKLPPPSRWLTGVYEGVPVVLKGEDAVRAAGAILPMVNRAGGGERQVREAVRVLEEAPSVETLYRRAGHEARRHFEASMWQLGDHGLLHRLPAPVRLALEMAAHEEQERTALEGELALLEQAWKDAEEIAGIADSLTLPPAVDGLLGRLKARVRGD